MKFLYQRLLLKTALIYLILGAILGLFLHLRPHFPLFSLGKFRTMHVHIILFGFLIQLIMGVALWMFPRKKKIPRYTSENEGLILYALLNSGILIRSIFEPFSWDSTIYYNLALLGMVLQIVSLIYFITLILFRIRLP